MEIEVVVAGDEHFRYAEEIVRVIEDAARARGTGIAKRTPEYVMDKMREGKAIIALDGDIFAGFCYIETWEHNRYVANSGLIVKTEYRQGGLARRIKAKAFELSRERYPGAKIFGITTSPAVMKINQDLGYRAVTFGEITSDEAFWNGCRSCPNFDILERTKRKYCLCTGMMYDPAWDQPRPKEEPEASAAPHTNGTKQHITERSNLPL